MRRLLLPLMLVVASLSGCAFFAGKPPLPKPASIERLPPPPARTDFAALVAQVDVIYFPIERVGHGGRSEPAARLIETLQQGGNRIALGWGSIDATQQSALDSLANDGPAERAQAIEGLPVVGSGRARAHCRSVLRAVSGPNVAHLALGYTGGGVHGREFAAERIAQFLRSAGSEAKALIFLREDDLESERGVPVYVEERIAVRQVVFGRERPRLLAVQ